MGDPIADTPLHAAAIRGDTNAVRTLLEAGADPNAPGGQGGTPLHAALEKGHRQVARILIAAGSALDAENNAGVSAREIAKALALWETDS